MGLITKEVWVGLGRNTKWYEELEYKIPRIKDKKNRMVVPKGTKILVKAEDVFKGSSVLIDADCDCCGSKLLGVKYFNVHFYDGKYYCQKCFNNNYEEWISFKKWCYMYLSKEEADMIMLKWDYILNKIGPDEVGYGSEGVNKKGHWFKCLDHPEHGSELTNLNDFTNRRIGSLIKCRKCNTLRYSHSHLVKYLKNEEDADNLSHGSKVSVPMICPDCGFEREMTIGQLTNQKFSCPKCSDGVSYSEKFLSAMLEQLDLIFIPQLSKTNFDWCNSIRYDNYIENINTIVEMHGIQHYEEIKGWLSLEETQSNDKYKKQLAISNSISNYIIIDCRKSTLNWIKDNIMKSELPSLLNFKELDIDWLKCHEAGLSNLVKISCNIWNNGIRNTTDISNIMKMHSSTIVRYLKIGTELGWCDYDPKEVMSHREYSYKKVICLTTNKIFESIAKASNEYKVNGSAIASCCCKTLKTAGKLSDGITKLTWMHYDEYITKTKEEIENIIDNALERSKTNNIKIICLTTNKIFNTITEASKEYNIDDSSIVKGCKGIQSFVGRHSITNEKMVWMYYDEYVLKTEDEIKEILNSKQKKIPAHFVKIICLTTGEIFNSQIEASRKYNISNTGISLYLKDREHHKYAGKHPETGERMTWEYYDKYLQQTTK